MKTRDQLRAERAASNVAGVRADALKDYIAETRSFAPMVYQDGLGATLATLKVRGGSARGSLYDHVSGWICETVFAEPKGDLLTLVTRSPSSKVLRAHEESLLYVGWLRRFAESREPKARKA
jgi:CRISPR/Cas system CMR-associated protein Cmr5 small subunit